MSMETAMAEANAPYVAQIMRETWGHLYPELGTESQGHFDFIHGSYSQMEGIVAIAFGTLPDSPVLFEDVGDFHFQQAFNRGPWEKLLLTPGVYRWSGTYRKCKNAKAQFIRGKLELRYSFESA